MKGADVADDDAPETDEKTEVPVGVLVLIAGMVAIAAGVALVSVPLGLVAAGALAVVVGGDIVDSAP